MARRNRLPEVEADRGVPLEVLIPALLSQMGTQKAVADHLGLSQATVSTWLKTNGYVPVVRWEKVGIGR